MDQNLWNKSQRLTIGSIAKLFNLNSSTLRFWEKKNLLNTLRNDNNYRNYDYQSLLEISDLVMMKNMGLTLEDMRKSSNMNLSQLSELYESRTHALEQQIHGLHEILSKISETRNLIAEINKICLCKKVIVSEPNVLQIITHKSINDPTVWRKYFSGQYQYGAVLFPNNKNSYDEFWGWIPRIPEPEEQSIWEYTPSAKTFAQCAMWVNVTDRDKNNIDEIRTFFRTHNYKTGVIIARYICTTYEYGSHNDFYKAWVEIEK
jgi:DNA-binding transcriptional MerR regulator